MDGELDLKGDTTRLIIDDLIAKRGMTRYRLAIEAGIPHATVCDICNGKTRLERCSAETVYKLAKTLDVSVESLIESGMLQTQREAFFERGLPDYLQHTLDAYKEGLKSHSGLLDLLRSELYVSINIAEINDGCITAEQANYLRKKYLHRGT